jgi:hypothetical protein
MDNELLDDLEAFLDNYSDCEGNSAADAKPNLAMRLLCRLQAEREKVKKPHWHTELVLNAIGELKGKLKVCYHCRECGEDFSFMVEKAQ